MPHHSYTPLGRPVSHRRVRAMVIQYNMSESGTRRVAAPKIPCSIAKVKGLRDYARQLERGDQHLSFADSQAVLDIGSGNGSVDWSWNCAQFVQRPPSEHELGRIVNEQANHHAVPDPQTLECFRPAADFLSQTLVRPTAAFKQERFLVVVQAVRAMKDMIEGPVILSMNLVEVLGVSLQPPSSTDLGNVAPYGVFGVQVKANSSRDSRHRGRRAEGHFKSVSTLVLMLSGQCSEDSDKESIQNKSSPGWYSSSGDLFRMR